MPTLENLDDAKSDGPDENENADDDFEIPDGLPGSRNPRKKPEGISYSRPERIGIDIPKRRGRPVGSRNRNSSARTDNTKVEQFWIEITALGLNLTTVFLAAKIFANKKFIMTKVEAESAAKGIMLVAFKYKQFRDFALIVNTQNDWAILAKAFWPYLQRVFVQEMINDVFSGLFVSRPKQQSNGKSPVGNGNGKSDGRPNFQSPTGGISENDGISFGGQISGFNDWRGI